MSRSINLAGFISAGLCVLLGGGALAAGKTAQPHAIDVAEVKHS